MGGRWPDQQVRNLGGDRLVAVRDLETRFLADQAAGRLGLWHPSPGLRLDTRYVARNIANIQEEWQIRWNANDGESSTFQRPAFDQAPMQAQMALVEGLRKIMGKA